MINKIYTNEIINAVKQVIKQPQKQQSDSVNNTDTRIDVRYDQMIEKAAQPKQPDPAKIEHAKKLLASNLLDNAENIRKAAENIINFGI